MSPFRRGKDKSDAPESAPPVDEVASASRADLSHLDGALDSFATVLRAWGAHPIEVPERSMSEIRDECEAWARHLLLATEPPGASAPLPNGHRDWVGLERAFRRLRQQEHGHVTQTQSELRHVIWVCIQALGKASAADARSDSQVSERLQHLREVSQSDDITALRKEVTAAVNLLDSHIETRRARHQSQVEELSEKLSSMTAAFIREREAGQLDALTKVYCRAALDDHMNDICAMAQVVKPTAIAFVMDVDHFKWVNDQFGHSVGDDVLKRVAAAMRQEFRRRGDFIARFGGDEFVAVIEEAPLDAAVKIGERVLMAVREVEFDHEGEKVRVGMSIGIAPLKQGQSPREWLDEADKALYASKEAGRDRLSVARSSE